MSALGLYAVDPVSGTYVLGTPLFERATITLPDPDCRPGMDCAKNIARQLTIETKRTGPSQKYVQSVALNGKKLDRLWVRHSELVSGATLTFTMGDQPNHQLGADQKVAPPSLTT